jgi:hypothetical protein
MAMRTTHYGLPTFTGKTQQVLGAWFFGDGLNFCLLEPD